MTVIVARDEFFARAAHGLYTEALLLSDETRAYFEGEGRSERDARPPLARVQFACEALKATTRLLQVIAWTSAGRNARPGPFPPACGSEPAVLGELPSAARRLILAGIDLFGRAGRLADGSDGAVAADSPARALLQRLERAV